MRQSVISRESPLFLASSSPRRKRLLKQIGVPFRSFSSAIKEDLTGGEPALNSRLLAEKKAMAVFSRSDGNWVLGADTIVVLDDVGLGKPGDKKEARSMLVQLSGREHRVITGFCLVDPDGHPAHSESVITTVKMKALTEREIRGYVATEEPFGKAGSYAIQGLGSFMVESISGSYTNVVGLPLCALVKALLGIGAIKVFPLTAGA
jgi:nucleoside triphosphate pyrophosphatase